MPTRIRLWSGIALAAVVPILIAGSLIRMQRSPSPQPGIGTGTGLTMPGEAPEEIVEFEIVEMKPSSDGVTPMRVWDARYPSASGAAHFEIAMELREAKPGERFASTRGVLTAREDSRPEGLLSALARAHHASRSLRVIGESSKSRAREVAFQTAILGTAVTRGRGARILAGEFTSDRPGPWILVKLLLPAEGAEIYVALNPSTGKGLFINRYDENWPDLEPILESVL